MIATARRIGLGFAGLLLLSACSGTPDKLVTCPEILIPQNTERVTRFAPGEGRDITDIVLQGEVKFLSGECEIGEEEITLDLPIAVGGTSGPADTDRTESISVFIAVSTYDRQILTRRELPMTLNFTGNRTSVVTMDTVSLDIPKKPDQTAQDFVIFLGLVLSEEELAYNREESRN